MRAKLRLKPGKERSLLRNHLWVFSGAIQSIEGEANEDDLVDVYSADRQYLASGFYQKSSITVRVVSHQKDESIDSILRNRIQQAFEGRKRIGLPTNQTNVFRLIHGEGDGLPGLIVDVYNRVAVVQMHTPSWMPHLPTIAHFIVEFSGGIITGVYNKSAESMGKQGINRIVFGEFDAVQQVSENGHLFEVNVETGQKTGFFIDQRFNRWLLGEYAQNATVLNTFCYSGGFSVYALNKGAKQVVSIDSSKKAIELTDRNVKLNSNSHLHHSICADVLPWLTENNNKFDIVVLDPPAFAKHQSARHKAIQAYRRLNAMGLSHVSENGLIFTFSCSQVVDTEMFRGAVLAAAIDSGRQVQILHQLSQPADHPVNIFHPEGEYLKGFVLRVF